MGHRLIGEILRDICGLSNESLEEALRIQEEKGDRIGEILVRQKAISDSDLLKALSIQFNLPFSSTLPIEDLNTEFTAKVPIQFLKKYKMVPVVVPNGAFIATNDPLLFQPLDDLRLLLGLDGIKVVVTPYSAILSTINFAYDMSSDSAEQVIQDMHEEDTDLIISEIEETGDLLEDTSDAPIIKLVNLMLSQAVKARASDIHIEPAQNRIKIRYRVDGVLYDRLSPPKHIQ
ncbi:MAG: type II secretion system protein GspE, partial [Proteobacteria bacterium]|nr:type II secretion system protein GspE [Pseudomonadota bacterium]